jgi:hypothetical protein
MFDYILLLLRGKSVKGGMTEKNRQFYTWGANRFRYIRSVCGRYGMQFRVTGLKFRGRVRVWYNPASDYFDIEFVRAIKDEVVKSIDDVCFDMLHDICHHFIERDDDMSCC